MHQHPLARADARDVRQREVGGEEDRGHGRCLRQGPPHWYAHDPPVIHDDNRSGAEELAHYTVAGLELEYIVGNLENDAGPFDAHVVVRGVTQGSQDIMEIYAAATQTQTHLAGPQGAIGFGTGAQREVPWVQRAVAKGAKPPGGRVDQFGAVDSPGPRQPRGKAHAIT